MATIRLQVQMDSGAIFTSTQTMADANMTRLSTDLQAMMGKTGQQILDYGLNRLMTQAKAMGKAYEESQVPVGDFT